LAAVCALNKRKGMVIIMKIRIKFSKYGAMKFIGHLDMMRFFQKAIRRADIDIKYSEGFSPHQIMSFAAPLGVGIESRGEYLDIEVNSMTTTEEMKAALNQTMTEGVEILDIGILPDNAKNAMASVAAASYRLQAKEGELGIPNLKDTVAGFYAQETIPYTKETKKSVMELDLKQGIYEMEAIDQSTIQMLVNASSSGNIKPVTVFHLLCTFADVEILPSAYQVTRLETYTNLADEGDPRHLVPLSECCLT
jgi:radical SAM-linked protein